MRKGNQRGQAITEYILMLAIALTLIGIMSSQFRSIRNFLWHGMVCDVAKACAHCPPDETIKRKGPRPEACK